MDKDKIKRLNALKRKLREWENEGYNVSPLKKDIEEFERQEGIKRSIFLRIATITLLILAVIGVSVGIEINHQKKKMKEVGYYDTPDTAIGVYVSGAYAYVADYGDYDAGLPIIDASNPSSPHEVGYYNTPGFAEGVYVSGAYAYVADVEAGLRIIKIKKE